ncbi:hypothetical protein AVEN_203100-1 [Araneus ventricosus]|uniref:Histone-lysine N-methyltransferase SETMAR n=1 Tax=Araneus ventricosus TaxID=182803 RepID=A0A4Y2DPS7_ARAVE|nr:hypothetical protein AVEN_203100-1 [Araneus ventricosus]
MLPRNASFVVLFAFLKRNAVFWKAINASVIYHTLRRLRRAILTSGVVLIHENTCPHKAVVTQQLLEQFKLDVSDHPTNFPDLAPSDLHLFPELKNWLRGQIFQKNELIQSNVKAYFTSLTGTFFKEGIGNQVHRYDKCLNLHNDYVEL